MKSAVAAPLRRNSTSGAMAKTWRGVPAAAQTTSNSRSRGLEPRPPDRAVRVAPWARPPIGKAGPAPRISPASALPRARPPAALALASSTPVCRPGSRKARAVAMVFSARKMIDLAILVQAWQPPRGAPDPCLVRSCLLPSPAPRRRRRPPANARCTPLQGFSDMGSLSRFAGVMAGRATACKPLTPVALQGLTRGHEFRRPPHPATRSPHAPERGAEGWAALQAVDAALRPLIEGTAGSSPLSPQGLITKEAPWLSQGAGRAAPRRCCAT